MPKPIIDWKGKSRKFSFMCAVCGKKLRTKKEAQTCEWADMNGVSSKAARIHKRRKERQNENNINDKSERRCRLWKVSYYAKLSPHFIDYTRRIGSFNFA